MGGLGWEDVENAAAYRVLAGKFHGLAPLIAYAFHMRDDRFKRHLFTDSQRQRQLAIERRLLGAKQCRCDGRDSDGDLLRGHAPQSDGALFGQLGMWRELLVGQHIQGRYELRQRHVRPVYKKVEECLDGFDQRFGLLVAIGDDQDGPLDHLPQQDQVEPLGRGGEAGKREAVAFAPRQLGGKFLEGGDSRQALQ